MKKRILDYMDYIDHVLENNDTRLTYEQILEEHKVQLTFFMHERLVHLLVTLTFAILAFGTFFILMLNFSLGLLVLLALFLVLLVPYIMHYYLLENSVQKMYRQYDKLAEIVNGKESLKHEQR
jgi:hypothetical protein